MRDTLGFFFNAGYQKQPEAFDRRIRTKPWPGESKQRGMEGVFRTVNCTPPLSRVSPVFLLDSEVIVLSRFGYLSFIKMCQCRGKFSWPGVIA